MRVGDLVKLQRLTANVWGLPNGIIMLLEKLPREDELEYDWKVLTETGRTIELGRQIEGSSELINESR